MGFLYPLVLLLSVPALLFCIWFIRTQYLAIREITNLVHPSKVSKLTMLLSIKDGKLSGYWKFWFYQFFLSISFLSLVVSLAGPNISGDSKIESNQTSVYFVFDGSWSMDAEDVKILDGYSYVPRTRFEESRFHSMELLKRNSDQVSFGVITFAGSAVQHSHPLPDPVWINDILFNQMNQHNTFYSGTNYVSAFQELINSSRYLGEGFQVVLYSDGDASEDEKTKGLEYIKNFSRLGIPVHVVALGTTQGAETDLTFNLLKSVVSNKNLSGDAAGNDYEISSNVSVQKRKSVPDFEFLRRIAVETGGAFIRTNEGHAGFDELSDAIHTAKAKKQTLLWEAGGREVISPYFFLLPFLFFLFDFLYIRRAVKLGF